MSITLTAAKQIELARQLLPDLEDLGNGITQATCPGADNHSTNTGKRDFRIYFEDSTGPHDTCFHKSCAAARDELMRNLYRLLSQSDKRHNPLPTHFTPRYTQAPTPRRSSADPYSHAEAVTAAAANPLQIDEDWLRDHSPIRIPADPNKWPQLLLNTLYKPGDKILIFTSFTSQGDLLHTVGPTYKESTCERLEKHPPAAINTPPKRRPSGYPKGGPNGVWFLAAPVTGDWTPNTNNRDTHGAKLGRRHAACCTEYPYLVLESDEAPPATWLKILTMLRDPICAIYTSGGKSYHALIRVNANTKEEFDLHRQEYITRLAAIGADPAAITAVRLTRLPGALRYGSGNHEHNKPYLDEDGKPAPRMQQLLYLNPRADKTPIIAQAYNTDPQA